MESLKPSGVPVTCFEGEPLVSLRGYNYRFTAFSKDLKYMAVSRSYSRRESEVMDIVLVRLRNFKEFLLLDTLTMIRYGRPNGILTEILFNDQDQLVAKVADGMKGISILTFDVEKREMIKDEYHDDYYDDEYEEDIDGEKLRLTEKMEDLKRIFPNKSSVLLSELVYKLMPVDSSGYLTQGILPDDNSIFFLPRKEGKLRLMHSISDPGQRDNIDGFWGNHEKVFYLLKDRKNSYFFRYDIKSNAVTLLEKYPPHSHFTYIYSYKLNNGDILLSFDVEVNRPEADETLKIFRYRNGALTKIGGYQFLQELSHVPDHNLVLLYYLENGKRCLDVRQIQN